MSLTPFSSPNPKSLLPVVVVLGHLCLGLFHDWVPVVWLPGNAEGEDVTDRGAVSAVQLPPNVFQNYGEVEEDDPYRYYQPNYPAPQPVSPEDPSLAYGDIELRSPGVHRSSRSVGSEGEKVGPKRRRKSRAKELPGLTN